MSTNLYAARVSSEHPRAIWPMDDGASYVSLISEYSRNNWFEPGGDLGIVIDGSDMSVQSWISARVPQMIGGAFVPFEDAGISTISVFPSGTAGPANSIAGAVAWDYSTALSDVPIAASIYVFLEEAWATSVDIGSCTNVSGDVNTTTHYTRNMVPESVYNKWIKVQTSEIDPTDNYLFVRFNLAEGGDFDAISFDLNGLAIGQYSETYSSSTLGVRSRSMGPYIKGRGVDIAATSYIDISTDIATSDANTITVPVKMIMDAYDSNDVYIDQDSLYLAKQVYNNFSSHKKIIIEPWPWIGSGYGGPEDNDPSTYADSDHPSTMDPATPSDWFSSWEKALKLLAKEMPRAWGMYVGSNLTLIEDEDVLWLALMETVRKRFDGKIMYKTNWWDNTTDAATKAALGLWAGADIAAVSAFFELNALAQPTNWNLRNSLTSTPSGQDVPAEVLAIYDTWGVPVILGDLTCPAFDYGAREPADLGDSSGSPANVDVQKALISAYHDVFDGQLGYLGFSVPYAGSTSDYVLDDSATEYVGWLPTSPIDDSTLQLAEASPFVPVPLGAVTTFDNYVELAGYSLVTGDRVRFVNATGGTVFEEDHVYYVRSGYPDTTTGSFQLSYYEGGLALTLDDLDPAGVAYHLSPSGYYVTEENRLLGHCTGIPLAYGSNTYNRLEASAYGNPSFVFDGQGAFNDLGRGQIYTIEFWMRVTGATAVDRKIFGPVEHSDGLYINGGVLTLIVGGNQTSANVGQMSNPMLVHIRLHDNRADLMVNGDPLASVDVNMSLPNWSDASNKMLGFYAPSELAPIDIDCVSVFAYLVPEVVAMRRFGWGQAVESTELSNSLFSGPTLKANFAGSNVAHSVSYPDNYSWESGVHENLSVEPDRISVPERSLPRVVSSNTTKHISIGQASTDFSQDTFTHSSHGLVDGDVVLLSNLTSTVIAGHSDLTKYYVRNSTQSTFKVATTISGDVVDLETSDGTVDITNVTKTKTYSESELFEDTRLIQDGETFFSLQPNEDWSEEPCFFAFQSLSDYIDLPKLFAVSWSATTLVGEETLAVIHSKEDRARYLRLYRDADYIKAEFVDASGATEIEATQIVADHRYTSVIDLTASKYQNASAPSLMRFMLRTLDDLEVSVGGDIGGSFTGKVYRISFMNGTVRNSLSDILSGYPTETVDYDALIADNKRLLDRGTYNLFPEVKYGELYPEISQLSYWEDYVPMSTLAGFVNNFNGDKQAYVDHIQFNIGVPKPSSLQEVMPIWAFFEALYGVTALNYQDFEDVYPTMRYGISYEDQVIGGDTIPGFLTLYDLTSGLYSGLEEAYMHLTYSQFQAYTNDISYFLPYVVDDLEIRTFVSFQRGDGTLQSLSGLRDVMPATSADIVYVDAFDIEMGDSIEVVDGTTIVAPKSRALDNMVMSVHLEVYARGTTKRPVSVKSLELVSYAQNKDIATDIGSQSGKAAYPFIYNNLYYDFSAINPFRLDKRGMPSLYLGRESGYVPTGLEMVALDRGIMTIVEEAEGLAEYEISCLHFWMRVDREFSQTSKKIYEFDDEDTGVKLSLMMTELPNDPERASLAAFDANGDPFVGISFYQNGLYVAEPVVSRYEWFSLSMYLDTEITLQPGASNSPSTKIKIYPGAVYNNVSYFPPDGLSRSTLIPREWSDISLEEWTYWSGVAAPTTGSSWVKVLYPGDISTSLSNFPERLYNHYIGNGTKEISDPTRLTITQGPVSTWGNYSSVTYRQVPS